jgi:magnesium chelatase family protein
MLAARLPGLLPPLDPAEALETSMIHSLAGYLQDGKLKRRRPFRDPHHSASLPALVGRGQRATLEALRQPMESGRVSVARVNAHVTYPARGQLVAAMNPCPCGHLDDPALACGRAPKCAQDYQARIRVLRVARTFDDVEGGGPVRQIHVAEALTYRRVLPGR